MLSKIRNTAAQIAAAAVSESFPSVQVQTVEETSVGFSCDLLFPHPLHPEFHLQIEETMRQIVREHREIRESEMVPISAREFFKSQGYPKELSGQNLIAIVQIGAFCNLSRGKHLTNTSLLNAFKLFPVQQLAGKGIRITGTAYPTKQELKKFLKKWIAYPKVRHEVLGEKRGLWQILPEGFFWMPKGQHVREQLICFFKENLFQDAQGIALPETERRHALWAEWIQKNNTSLIEILPIENHPAEGLLDPQNGIELTYACTKEKFISFLQSARKTLNMLDFSYCTRLIVPKRKGKDLQALAQVFESLQWSYEVVKTEKGILQVQYLVVDGLDRKWSVVDVHMMDELM